MLLQGSISRYPVEVQSTSKPENLEAARLSPKLSGFEDRAWRNGSSGCVGKVQKQKGPRSVGEGLALGSPNRIHRFWELLGSSFITMSARGGPSQFAQASGRHLGQSNAGPDGLWLLWSPSRLDPPGSSGELCLMVEVKLLEKDCGICFDIRAMQNSYCTSNHQAGMHKHSNKCAN